MPVLSLIKIESPKIKGKEILEGEHIGGIRLTYQEKKAYTNNNADTLQQIVFLKPFKHIWADSKKDCAPNEWGNTLSPLTTVWLKLTTGADYTNWDDDVMFIRYEQVKDHKLIAALNREEKTLITDREYQNTALLVTTHIPLTEAIKYKASELVDRIKESFN